MKILLIDNFDSFTYNLLHYVEQACEDEVKVVRNDALTLDEIRRYDKILLSPGPGLPQEAGITMDVIREFSSTKSILGVCLGHQAIAEAFGGKLKNLPTVSHGVATPIFIENDDSLFNGLPSSFEVGRYHSWVLDENNIPSELIVTARDGDGIVMAIKHKTLDVKGVQFHPESIMTPFGLDMIRNWIRQPLNAAI